MCMERKVKKVTNAKKEAATNEREIMNSHRQSLSTSFDFNVNNNNSNNNNHSAFDEMDLNSFALIHSTMPKFSYNCFHEQLHGQNDVMNDIVTGTNNYYNNNHHRAFDNFPIVNTFFSIESPTPKFSSNGEVADNKYYHNYYHNNNNEQVDDLKATECLREVDKFLVSFPSYCHKIVFLLTRISEMFFMHVRGKDGSFLLLSCFSLYI